jgi:hypothetical protein
MSTEVVIPKKRGRPPGSKGKSPKFRNYQPKKWKPVFTEIVILEATGSVTNVELGEKYGFTAQHISNICCTEQAEDIRKGLREKLIERGGSIAERLVRLQDKALKRVEDYIEKDFLFEKSPESSVDRALKILSAGEHQTVNNTVNNTQQNNLILSPEIQERLMKGLTEGMGLELHNPDSAPFSITNE